MDDSFDLGALARKAHELSSERTARPGYSTEEAARRLHVKPQTLRAALCRDGAYLGVRPRKMANRMLDWPAEQIDALAGEHRAG